MKRQIALAIVLGCLVFTPSILAQQATRTAPPNGGFPDLVGGLQKTPGCLGVETARTASGKQVIFAWFENKKAVLNWYYSDTHVAAMSLTGLPPGSHPLEGVADDGQPVLAIASLTLTNNPANTSAAPSFSQIAIELYRPLPGGVAVGGRFAPASLQVPGLRDIPSLAPAPSPRVRH